jgi:hypothetical protein
MLTDVFRTRPAKSIAIKSRERFTATTSQFGSKNAGRHWRTIASRSGYARLLFLPKMDSPSHLPQQKVFPKSRDFVGNYYV